LKHILALEEATPKKYKFSFSNYRNSAKINTKIIKKYNYNFINACEKQKGSIISPGTEFRNISHLTKLFSNHEDLPELKFIIENGCDYKLSPKLMKKRENKFSKR